MRILALATALLSAPALAGEFAPVLDHVANRVITQTYVDLAGAARVYNSTVHAFAQEPTLPRLEAAQKAWRDMRVPWEASEAFLFGPVKALGIDPTIDTWPLNIRDLDAVLASGRALTVDFVRGLGVNLQGFHVGEYILFGNGENGPHKALAEFTPRQFEYLKATSTLLVEHTGKLADAWLRNADPDRPSLPGYASFLAKPGPRNPYYRTEVAVLIELTRGIITIIQEVADGKLTDPMGGDIGAANPSLVESPFSWNSLNDFTDNIRSALAVYTGTHSAARGPGLRDVVRAKDARLAAEVEQRMNTAAQKILDIAGPQGLDFRQAIKDPAGRQRIEAAITYLNDLNKVMTTRVLRLIENL